MSNKQKYREWCLTQPNLPLFMQSWWMEAVCEGKDWDALLLPSGAMMPYLLRKRLGMRFVVMPQQTQINGVAVPQQINGAEMQQTERNGDCTHADSPQDIASAIDSLHLAYYYQKYPIGSPVPQALRKHGFTVSEMVTYRIEDLSDEEALIRRFSENKRRQLKKAASLTLDLSLSPTEFYAYHKHCLSLRCKYISYGETFWNSLFAACKAHNAGQLIALRDADGRIAAAAFVVYDADSCYYLIPTYDSSMGNNGAGARLVLEAIRFARTVSRSFDFEGSMIPSVAEHYSQFGSTATTYYSVEKVYNPLFKLLLLANNLRSRKKK